MAGSRPWSRVTFPPIPLAGTAGGSHLAILPLQAPLGADLRRRAGDERPTDPGWPAGSRTTRSSDPVGARDYPASEVSKSRTRARINDVRSLIGELRV